MIMLAFTSKSNTKLWIFSFLRETITYDENYKTATALSGGPFMFL